MSDALTAQIAADPDMVEARNVVEATVVEATVVEYADISRGAREGSAIACSLRGVAALDAYRDAVIAATARLMQESAPEPVWPIAAADILKWLNRAHWYAATVRMRGYIGWVAKDVDADARMFFKAMHAVETKRDELLSAAALPPEQEHT